MTTEHYVGTELELFAKATRWKAYLKRLILPHYGSEVLEVGAGIGGTTRVFYDESVTRWVCLEPDPELASQLQSSELPAACEVIVGTLATLPDDATFDTILYIDVLEHIEDDASELARAAARLKPGGRLVVLSPAHQFLFTPFDAAIGHFRRYSRPSLRAAAPPNLKEVRASYLDAAGMSLSLANRLVLKSAMPTAAQIAFWDGWIVPISRVIDPLLLNKLGKSILGVWRKESSHD